MNGLVQDLALGRKDHLELAAGRVLAGTKQESQTAYGLFLATCSRSAIPLSSLLNSEVIWP